MHKKLIAWGLAALLGLTACGGPAATATTAPPTQAPVATSAPATVAPTKAPAATQTPAATLTAEPPTATTAPTDAPEVSPVEYVSTIVGDPNAFGFPTSLAFDTAGNMYVVDSLNNRIQVFDADGQFVTMWDQAGSGDGQFNFQRPLKSDAIGGIAIDGQDNVYVVDTGNFRVEKFDVNGQFLLQWGGKGDGNGQFSDPLFAAVDADGNVFVVDDVLNTVQKFDGQGTFLLQFGEFGHGDGQIQDPGQIAVGPDGSVYVADYHNNRIDKFSGDGAFVLAWGSSGGKPDQFSGPSGMAVDADGNVYVSNFGSPTGSAHQWIQKFTAEGEFLGKWGEPGDGPGEFHHPLGLGIDPSGNIYVVDTENNRVQKFKPV